MSSLASIDYGPSLPRRATAVPYTAATTLRSCTRYGRSPTFTRSYGFTKDAFISGSVLVPAETDALCQVIVKQD